VPDRPLPGRSLVSRRSVVDIVRSAVVTSYGVIGVDATPLERLLGWLDIREPGIRVRLDRGIEIDLHLVVGYGLPIAEVARQVDSAVRYAVRHALGHEVRRLTVHVAGLRYQPASVPPARDVHHAGVAASGPDAAATEPEAATVDADGHGRGEVASGEPAGTADGHDGRGATRSRRRRSSAGRPDDT
jgi:uncharacterized alkaline shock family protein YloU